MLHDIAHPVEPAAVASSVVALSVALMAIAFASIAFGAARKTQRGSLTLVGWAFVLFAVKNAFVAYNVWTHTVPHDWIELVSSVGDMGLLVLLLSPLLVKRRS